MTATIESFAGKGFVVRVDAQAVCAHDSTLLDDLSFLTDANVRPVIVAPNGEVARVIVRSMNRSKSIAVGLNGSDAALLPQTPNGIGRVHTGLLATLLDAGYIPVIDRLRLLFSAMWMLPFSQTTLLRQ